jgi:CubicO group peptidase (beta-lactamase class C family)
MKTEFQELLLNKMELYHVPGISIAIIENAEISHVQAFGFANAETKQPVTEKTVFQAASLTKPIFAYLVIKLARTGIIDLDAPLSDYLFEPSLQDDPMLPKITARRVLCHTTGLPNWRGKNSLHIHFTPGERWAYSGEGYVYLQHVIEHQTSQTLQDFKPYRIYYRLTFFKRLG